MAEWVPKLGEEVHVKPDVDMEFASTAHQSARLDQWIGKIVRLREEPYSVLVKFPQRTDPLDFAPKELEPLEAVPAPSDELTQLRQRCAVLEERHAQDIYDLTMKATQQAADTQVRHAEDVYQIAAQRDQVRKALMIATDALKAIGVLPDSDKDETGWMVRDALKAVEKALKPVE